MTGYTIIIEKGDPNYSAYCPDLPGVVAAADGHSQKLKSDGIEALLSPFPSGWMRDYGYPARH